LGLNNGPKGEGKFKCIKRVPPRGGGGGGWQGCLNPKGKGTGEHKKKGWAAKKRKKREALGKVVKKGLINKKNNEEGTIDLAREKKLFTGVIEKKTR